MSLKAYNRPTLKAVEHVFDGGSISWVRKEGSNSWVGTGTVMGYPIIATIDDRQCIGYIDTEEAVRDALKEKQTSD